MKTMDWLNRLCRLTLGVIFIYAGSTKLLEPKSFAVLIEAYGLIPEGLILEPEILLCDEPTSSLDSKAAGIIEELLVSLKKDCTLLVVSHYLDFPKAPHLLFTYPTCRFC